MGKQKRERQRAEERKMQNERRNRMFVWLAFAIGLGSWGYTAVSSAEPSLYFGSFLFLMSMVFFLIAGWGHFQWRRKFKLAICGLAVLCFFVVDGFWIQYMKRPSFVFVAPGIWVNSNSWDFVVGHRGRNSNFDVDMVFQDTDRLRSLQHEKTSLSDDDMSNMMRHLHFDEVNPKGRGTFFATQFVWMPFSPELEHYDIEITSREGHEHQTLSLARINGKWFYRIEVVDAENGKPLLKCEDRGFPDSQRIAKEECFPDVLEDK